MFPKTSLKKGLCFRQILGKGNEVCVSRNGEEISSRTSSRQISPLCRKLKSKANKRKFPPFTRISIKGFYITGKTTELEATRHARQADGDALLPCQNTPLELDADTRLRSRCDARRVGRCSRGTPCPAPTRDFTPDSYSSVAWKSETSTGAELR